VRSEIGFIADQVFPESRLPQPGIAPSPRMYARDRNGE